ncbi:MAG: tetratricopeptide repeat protein, partial [Polyangia bacterium]|nr:tetratricopeptide repeat protein [Polyangia bacterium]
MSRPPTAPDPKLNERLAAFLESPEDEDFAAFAEQLMALGRHADAERVCKAGLTRRPDDLDGRRALGQALLRRG